MAHIATKKFSYWGQLGVLMGLVLAGFIVGNILGIIPLIGKINFADFFKQESTSGFMDSILKPENANALRIMQFITTLFMFFLPAWFYAKICHKKSALHLGFTKAPSIKQLGLVLAIVFSSLLIMGAMQEVWSQIPFPKSWQATFKAAEDEYNKQMQAMARMNGFGDFLFSLFIVALLPAVFEEVIFRGAIQNLLSRWWKGSIWAVIFTSIVFSIIHFSYDGFIVRTMLGFILGWMYYRTGNIWLPVFAHFINNAIGVVVLFAISKPGQPTDLSKMQDHFPIWLGAIGIIGVIGLLKVLDRVSEKDIDKPGEEVLLFGYEDPNNPFIADVNNIGNKEI